MKAIVLDTKKEDLEGESVILLDPTKVASLVVERSVNNDGQKYSLRILGVGMTYTMHIVFSKASKMTPEAQKTFLMNLQARLANEIWEDRTPETRLISEKMGL